MNYKNINNILKIKKLLKIASRILFPLKHLSKKNKKILVLSSLSVILIMLPIITYSLLHLKNAEAAWFNNNWGFREAIPVTSTEGAVQNNVFISFTLDTATLITAGKMQSNCNDIRITDVNGNLLKYHIGRVNACNNAATSIDFLLSSFPDGQSIYYIYYGNPSAPTVDAGSLTVNQASASTITASGNEITDTVRATATQGDGLYPSATNLVTNGGFETNTTGWANIGTGTITRTTSTSKFGTASLDVGTSAINDGTQYINNSSTQAQGSTFTASLWVKAKTGGDIGKHVQVFIESRGGTYEQFGYSGDYFGLYTLTTNYVRLTWSGTWANTGHTGYDIVIRTLSGDQGASFNLDGTQLETGSVTTDYIETNGAIASRYPDSSYGIWQGATNLHTNGGIETNTTGHSGGTNTTIARDTSQAKFGTASLKVTSQAAGTTYPGCGFSNTLGGATAGLKYTYSVWILGSGASVGKTLRLQVNELGGATGQALFGYQDLVLSSSWQKYTVSGTVTQNDRTSLDACSSAWTASGTNESVYMDGFQIEAGSIATPYIETNGGTAARSGGNVTVPNATSAINPIQGWFAMRVRLPSTYPGGTARYVEAGTGFSTSKWLSLGTSNSGTYMGRGTISNPNPNNANISSAAFAGQMRTVVGAWTATQVMISVDGSAFVTQPNTDIPADVTGAIKIENDYWGSQPLDADTLWFAAGKGTITNADASTINGWGNTDPTSVQLSALNGGLATPTLVWNADTTANTQTTYSQSPARNYTISALATEEVGAAPVAYWKFDEGTGTTAKDSSSNKKDGTITGTTWNNNGTSNKALNFAGPIGNYVSVPATPSITTGTPFTISAWVNPITNSGGYRTILGYDGTHRLLIDSNGKMLSQQDGNFFSNNNNDVPDNTWTHVAYWFNGTEERWYINGKQSGSHATTLAEWNAAFKIGQYDNVNYPYKGSIDEVKIYRYARSVAQIKADFAARGGNASGVVLGASDANKNLSNGLTLYWEMNEATWSGTLGEIVDSSGNGYNGTAQGTTGGKAYPTAGKFGNGEFSDGIDDYISTSSLTWTPTAFSVAYWINPTSLTNYNNGLAATNAWGAFDIHTTSGGAMYAGTDLTNRLTPTELPNGTITTNQWQHFVFTFVNNRGCVYKNGTLLACKSGMVNPVAWTGFQVGGTGAAVDVNGKTDEVRIYNRALSPTEVSQLYNYAPGPVGYWNFEEGSGSSINDISGNGNTGTWNGSGTNHWIQGKYGKGGNFNGTNDTVSIANQANFNFEKTTSFSIGAWVNTSTSQYFPIFGKTINSGAPAGYIFFVTAGGSLRTQLVNTTSPSNYINVQGGSVNDGKWHYVAMTYDGSGVGAGVSFYKDGTKIATSVTVDTLTGSITNSLTPYIGSRNNGDLFGSGKIDEVKVYNYTRTPGQITQDMNASHPLGGSPVGSQLGYWKFDEGYGSPAHDSGPHFYNANINTATWKNDDCKFNKCLYFNGTDSYVNPSGYSTSANSQMSFTFWAKPESGGGSGTSTFISDSGQSGTSGFIWIYKSPTSSTTMNFQYANGTNPIALAFTNAAILNEWHYYAFIADYSNLNNVKLYRDGILISTQSMTTPVAPDSTNLFFGRYSASHATSMYQGLLDEVKVYGAALTASEVKIDYNHGATQVLGSMSDTSGLIGGQVASNSASAAYCIPGDTSTCSSPVGEWNFEEKNGTIANDLSGNNNNATLQNTATWASGKIGSALSLATSASANNALTSTATNLGSSGALTLQAWVYPTAYGTEEMTVIQGQSPLSYYLSVNNDGAINCYWYSTTPAGYHSSGANTVPLNTWTHITCAWDGSNIRLYTNGVLKNTVGVTGNGADPGVINIGAESTTRQFKGKIDQVRIFNYARTPAQIAYDYNRGGPVGYWKFDECQGTTANDSSGNVNTGTITIGATGTQTSAGTCTTASTAWGNGATGKYNASLNFDGTDDYVTVTNNSIFNLADTNHSFSSWFKISGPPTDSPGMILQRFTGGSPGAGYYLAINSNSKAYYENRADSSNGPSITSDASYNDSIWHQLIITVDISSKIAKMYIDGKYIKSDIYTGNLLNQNANLTIGGQGTNYSFQGQMDDIRIYNYALTQTQIKQVYNQGAGVRFGP